MTFANLRHLQVYYIYLLSMHARNSCTYINKNRPIQVSSIQTAAAAAIGLRNHGLRLVHRDCLGFRV